MKITRSQIRKQIRKIILEQMSKTVDIMDDVSDAEISSAWPESLTLEGENVFDMIYNNSSLMNQIYSTVEADGYDDPNEVYLGYDFDTTDFIMGFDAFGSYEDEYGDREYGDMEGVFVNIRTVGGVQAGRVILTVPGGVYDRIGRSELRSKFPSLLDIRLD